MKYINSRKLLSLQDISAFENRFTLKLPSLYTDFLLSHNGGRPERKIFSYIDGHNIRQSSIHEFFPLKYDDKGYNLDYYIEMYKGRICESVIPIADDCCGNLICLCVDGAEYGKLFFWDHEHELESNELFALSFQYIDAFLEKLQEDVETDELRLLIRGGKIETLKEIINKDPDFIYRKANYNTSLVELATIYNRKDILEFLLRYDIDSDNLFLIAAQNNSYDTIELIHKSGRFNIDSKNEMGRTSLMISIIFSFLSCIGELLKYGADPRIKDDFGDSSFDHAIFSDDQAIKDIFKKYGHIY